MLSGRLREQLPVRPPWALSEDAFIEACDGCSKCISACPTQLLQSARGRYPRVNFSIGVCTFCRACLESCPTSALTNTDEIWPYKAVLNEKCLSTLGVMCRACGDKCEYGAIHYRLIVGGFSKPLIDLDACTACGVCLAQCPVDALEIKIPSSDKALPS